MSKALVVDGWSGRKTYQPLAQSKRAHDGSSNAGAVDRGLFGSVGEALQTFCDRIAEFRRLHREQKELIAMTDCELADIGIVRTDIPEVIAGRGLSQTAAHGSPTTD